MNLKKVKSRLKDEKLDLSLCDLKEVPIREIATIKKATHLDLSNNLLTSLSSTFVDLKQIVILDLSRNMLTEIPENFGELKRLKHLDLYANQTLEKLIAMLSKHWKEIPLGHGFYLKDWNSVKLCYNNVKHVNNSRMILQISRLPLSLSELKSLRWLDLKENPLTPAVASVAGPCSNLSECQACARNIVTYLSSVKLTIEEEKLRRLNAITADMETGTVPTKKGGRKKKKKILDKNNKQNLDENGSNQSSEVSLIDEDKIEPLIITHNRNQADKTHETKGNAHRFFMSMISWLFLFGLALTLMIVILPLYSKQSELFIEYIESKTGIHLKAFQKYSTDVFDSFIQAVINICDNLYHAYEKNFKTEMNIPANK